MAYSKIRQPKLSDVIEQQLEFLILEGTLRPGEKLPPERELAKQFDVSRPSLREAIQRLEAKGLLLRRQGGGTFVQSSLWQSFSDPLVELLSDHPESQFDLLETRHALEGIAAYYAALRSNDEDRERIRELHQAIERAQQSGDLDAESDAVVQYQIAVTEAAHMWCCSICYAVWSRCWPRTFVRTLNCCMPVGRCSRWSATIALAFSRR
jgi:GntR family transcriptional repressor for pyruvate dehydrogenase complex